MFLNLGPNHPSAHGAFRVVLQLDGEEIVDCVPDIGYHHRGAEKMGERQSWHSTSRITDRIDYLGGVMNNLPYVLAHREVGRIVGPPRAQRSGSCWPELFRIISHLFVYGTYCRTSARCSRVLHVRRPAKGYDVIEAITGFRMHPAWFRIGGVAHDLPSSWETKVREFVEWMPKRLNEYRKAILENAILVGRSRGVAHYDTAQALSGASAGLRATGC